MTSAFLPVVPYAILLWDAVVLVLVGREIHFSLLKIAFLPLSKMTFVRHRKVEAWNEESVGINLAFVFFSDLDSDIVSKMGSVQPSGPRRFRKGPGHRCMAQWTIRYSSVQGWLCLPPQEGHSFHPYLVPPWFSGHAV